jgi:hypothetical protein
MPPRPREGAIRSTMLRVNKPHPYKEKGEEGHDVPAAARNLRDRAPYNRFREKHTAKNGYATRTKKGHGLSCLRVNPSFTG